MRSAGGAASVSARAWVPARTSTPSRTGEGVAAWSRSSSPVRTSAVVPSTSLEAVRPRRLVRLPCWSRSMARTCRRRWDKASTSSAAVVLLPTPPLGVATVYVAMI